MAQDAATGIAELPYTSLGQQIPRMATRSSSGIQRTDTQMPGTLPQQRDDPPKPKAAYPYELWEDLNAERERLLKDQSYMNKKNRAMRRKLESLKARDEAEMWEDELYETRGKELNSANAVIETHSSASDADVYKQVKGLNKQIVHISSKATEVPSTRDDQSATVLESITNILGQEFLFLFDRKGTYLGDRRLAQAILQIFLAQSCAKLVDCWHIGDAALNSQLDQLHDRILNKGEHFNMQYLGSTMNIELLGNKS